MIYLNNFDTHASYEEKLNGCGGVDISLPNVSYCEDVKDVHYLPYNLVRFYVGEVTPPQTVKIYTDSSTFEEVQVSEVNKWYTYVLPKDKGLYKIEGDSVKKVTVKADIDTNGNAIIPRTTIEASFKGSNVISMIGMFSGCKGLTSLDLSNFNTSGVTSMMGMFSGCNGLTSLDVSSFDTSNVTTMFIMFNSCSSLTSLNLSNFNTSNVTNMMRMFNGCSSLTSLDISGWNTSNVTTMSGMFYGCAALKTITMKGCDQTTIDKIKAQLETDGITGVTIYDGKTGVTITQ